MTLRTPSWLTLRVHSAMPPNYDEIVRHGSGDDRYTPRFIHAVTMSPQTLPMAALAITRDVLAPRATQTITPPQRHATPVRGVRIWCCNDRTQSRTRGDQGQSTVAHTMMMTARPTAAVSVTQYDFGWASSCYLKPCWLNRLSSSTAAHHTSQRHTKPQSTLLTKLSDSSQAVPR